MPTATSLAITCVQTIVSASHWVGLIFPGMNELPGSLPGMRNSPMPERGPEASQRTSLASFIKAVASSFSAPWVVTIPSWAAMAAKRFGALTNGRPQVRARAAATRVPNSGWVLSPVPTAVPPIASG